MTTQTLTQFLDARIAEDEDAANEAGDYRGPRLRAEVKAKRRLVFEAKRWDADRDGPPRPATMVLAGVLRILAAVYAAHPDYNPDWRP